MLFGIVSYITLVNQIRGLKDSKIIKRNSILSNYGSTRIIGIS